MNCISGKCVHVTVYLPLLPLSCLFLNLQILKQFTICFKNHIIHENYTYILYNN